MRERAYHLRWSDARLWRVPYLGVAALVCCSHVVEASAADPPSILPTFVVNGRVEKYPEKIRITMQNRGKIPFCGVGAVLSDSGRLTPGRRLYWVGTFADEDLKTSFYAQNSKWSSQAPFSSVGQFIPILQGTYKTVSASGEGGGVNDRWIAIELQRVDALPDGGKACFIDLVYCIPILDSRMFQEGDYPPERSYLFALQLRLFEPKNGDRMKSALLWIKSGSTLHDRGLPKVNRWVTVSKDSVFNLRDDKEMKVWLKVVDFVPRNDELGITGWIRVMRVDEPATPKTPSPPSQPQPSP
jgi:hypothetical protein